MSGYRRLSARVEDELIGRILSGQWAIGSEIPLERDLAAELNVGLSTLREAIKGLERDGWLDVDRGRPTRVTDFWRNGTVAVLSALAERVDLVSDDLVIHLLELRAALTPTITGQAVATKAPRVVALLAKADTLPDRAVDYARFDWRLQKGLAQLSGNPVYPLLFNSFDRIYPRLAERYFTRPANRRSSAAYYTGLLQAAMAGDAARAEALCGRMMADSIRIWQRLKSKVVRLAAAGQRG